MIFGKQKSNHSNSSPIVKKTKPKNASKVVTVQLFVSAKNLTDLDLMSKSDPFCTLRIKNDKHAEYRLLGKTEVIDNDLNPKWVNHFNVEYYPEGSQVLLFTVYDEDLNDDNIDAINGDVIGSAEIVMADIMNMPRQVFTSALVHKKALRGTLKIKADVVSFSNDSIKLQFLGDVKSTKFLCCGSDNPYLLIERARMMSAKEI